MSRYDRQRERKRLFVIGGVIVAFFVGFLAWGHAINAGFDDIGRVDQERR